MPPDRRSNVRRALAPLFIATVAAVAIVLTVQGWRSRAPAFDLLTYIYSARDFLDTGVLPRHGDTGSYGSYKPFVASYNITNPRYKVGAEFDIFFRLRHGIANTNRCAEGIAAADDYRVVQTKPKSPAWAPRHYFRVDHGGFDPLAHVASYRILGRQ